jgi:hypothetical protein
MLTRMGEARDWKLGIPLKASMLGKMSRLEVHHIFPKAQLYKRKAERRDVNALGNFCFLTKDTNLDILDGLPSDYFPRVEEKHPGALASQWIPMDTHLWKIENYLDFLTARRTLLAAEANKRLEELLHGDLSWLEGPVTAEPIAAAVERPDTTTGEEEDALIAALNDWVAAHGLPRGEIAFDYADAETGKQRAVFDLAWPIGVQQGLSSPVAVLLNEGDETLALANGAGFRCFTSPEAFKNYVSSEILGQLAAA